MPNDVLAGVSGSSVKKQLRRSTAMPSATADGTESTPHSHSGHRCHGPKDVILCALWTHNRATRHTHGTVFAWTGPG